MNLLRRVTASMVGVLIQTLNLIIRPLGLLQNWLQLVHMRNRFQSRPDDIFIVTAPKAGTTWTQMILYQLVTGGRGEFDHIYQRSPWLEHLLCQLGRWKHLEKLPSPRLLKTHLLYEHIKPHPSAKCIYVTRNARDCIVSFYHHLTLITPFNIKFDPAFRQGLNGSRVFPGWLPHLMSWWPHRHDPNVLWLRYEDMVADTEGAIRKIAAFCNIPIREEDMGEILRKCGIEYMKQHTGKFDPRFSFYDHERHNSSRFIRNGHVGAQDTNFQDKHQLQLDQVLAEVRRKLRISESEL